MNRKFRSDSVRASSKAPLTLALVSNTHFGAIGTLVGAVPLSRVHNGTFDKVRGCWCFPLVTYSAFEADLRAANPTAAFDGLPANLQRLLAQPHWTDAGALRTTVEPAAAFDLLHQKLPLDLLTHMKTYQRAGVIAAVERNGRVLLGDDMGLGKTLQALAVAEYYRSEWPCLVVCPSSLRENWAREAQHWLHLRDADIQILQTKKMACLRRPLTIVSYEMAKSLEKNAFFRVVICDECHFMKSGDAARTKEVRCIVMQAARAVLMSGTPALSRPMELFSQLNMLAPKLFADPVAFGKRYCNGFQGTFGWDFTGSSNLDELHVVLSNTVLIRRLKRDCLQELPAKNRLQILVEPSLKSKQILDALRAKLHLLSDKSRGGQPSSDAERLLLNHTVRGGCRFSCLKRARQLYLEAGRAKLDGARALIMQTLSANGGDEKLLVFAHHADILNELDAFLVSQQHAFIRIDGTTAQGNRQSLCDTFQTEPRCRVALLGLTAAGVGLTLHAATTVLFAELYWNPGQLLQAEDRAHRVGQRHTVDIKYLICPGSLDETQWRVINSKLKVVGESVNGARDFMRCDDDTADPDGGATPLSGNAQAHQRLIDEFFLKVQPGDAPVQSASSWIAASSAAAVVPVPVAVVPPSVSPRTVCSGEPNAKRPSIECSMCGEILPARQLSSHMQLCLADIPGDIDGDGD